jgi:hypothetical protein
MIMKKIIAAVLLAVAACGSDERPQTTGEHVIEMCGESPAFPGLVVAFEVINDQPRVLMTPVGYQTIEKYHDDVLAWNDCVSNLP